MQRNVRGHIIDNGHLPSLRANLREAAGVQFWLLPLGVVPLPAMIDILNCVIVAVLVYVIASWLSKIL